MKAKFIATAVMAAFLFTGINAASFAQDKNVKQQVKTKTETTKPEVKTKTEEGMKTQTPVETKKVEQSKDKVKHLKSHKPKSLKSKETETKSETK